MPIQSPKSPFFLLLLSLVTVGFAWLLWPFFGAILWAVTLALLFHPLERWIHARVRRRANISALLTLLLCLLIVILPLSMIATSLVTDVVGFVQKLRSGDIDYLAYYQQIVAAIPPWLHDWFSHFDFFNPETALEKLSSGLMQGGQLVATHALEVGQNTFQFLINFAVMLYLLFFLLRDGQSIARTIGRAIPMQAGHTEFLRKKFATVVRATVKGNVVIALIQGALGGLAFWVLGISGALFWGVVMAVLSLLPAIGAALIWAPVAIYLLATGATWSGVLLTIWGVVAIGASDNLLRPILIGKDTKLPDYLVLVSTLGGMALFGINGFVIGPTIAAMFIACWALFQREHG